MQVCKAGCFDPVLLIRMCKGMRTLVYVSYALICDLPLKLLWI